MKQKLLNNIMEQTLTLSDIGIDTLRGLTANPKYLLPKYFYDDNGSRIFQDIMDMQEYYLTKSELEIFETYKEQIANLLIEGTDNMEVIELGSGDGTKTMVLLKELFISNVNLKYLPLDISRKANEELATTLNVEIPELTIEPKTGDYFNILNELNKKSDVRRVILFLGANIGNYSSQEMEFFIHKLSGIMLPGDKILTGFDLKKSPKIIMKAYDDAYGHTKKFNINHLKRINKELGGNFNTNKFEHHTEYNPLTGAVKSYLISNTSQNVYIQALGQNFSFYKWEPVFMEQSRKFDAKTIQKLANDFEFIIEQNFYDSNNYFVDSLWSRR